MNITQLRCLKDLVNQVIAYWDGDSEKLGEISLSLKKCLRERISLDVLNSVIFPVMNPILKQEVEKF